MSDKEFYDEVDKMFESQLSDGSGVSIKIKDLKKGVILENMDYNLVVFDSNMNIYKIKNGGLIPVEDPNFKAVVIDGSK